MLQADIQTSVRRDAENVEEIFQALKKERKCYDRGMGMKKSFFLILYFSYSCARGC